MTFRMVQAVTDFVAAHSRLKQHYHHTGLGFTIDGKLLGDLGEVIAAELFGLVLCENRTPGVDGHAPDGRSVQVKATGLPGAGPAFSPGEGIADHLIFLRLDFATATGVVAYNGPEAPIRRLLPINFKTSKRVLLHRVLATDATLSESDRLPRLA